MTTLKASLLAVLLGVSTLAAAAQNPSYAFRLTSPGVRAETAAAPAVATPPLPPSKTVLLLHFDGPTFVDSSATPKSVQVYRSAVRTASSRFGDGALAPADTASGLVVAGSSDFAFPAGTDFTIEAQVYSTTTPTYKQIVGQWGSTNSWQLALSSGRLGWVTPSGWSPLVSAQPLSLNAWHHVAITRQGTTQRMFLDGVLVGQTPDNLNYTFSLGDGLGIGRVANQDGYGFAGGAIDEVRITKGEAVYTAAFTPPTAAFTR